MAAGGVRLYAVVPAGEARAAIGGAARLRAIACGSITGIAGRPPRSASALRAAVLHDRIVGRAVMACSSVVPFRSGTAERSVAVLREVLAANASVLVRLLVRLADRAEMGLRVQLRSPAAIDAAIEALRAGLASIRALAPSVEDRRERLIPGAAGLVLDGCYLVSRGDIAAYWRGVGQLRAALPGAPVLGSGPWAAYSFCDQVIRPAPGRQTPAACWRRP